MQKKWEETVEISQEMPDPKPFTSSIPHSSAPWPNRCTVRLRWLEPPKAFNIVWAEVPKMCFTTRAWRPLSRSLRNGVCQLSSRRAFALFSPISFLAIASIVLLKPAF